VSEVFQKLDVFLRGSRDYVQGSQILGRTADWLLHAGIGGAVLFEAKFSRITRHPVIAFRQGQTDPVDANRLIGKARYRFGDQTFAINYADADGESAPWIDDQPSKLEAFSDNGELHGEARVVLDGTQEGYLSAVIETVKKLHQSLATNVTDIWFTALSGANLPVVPGHSGTAVLSVEPLLARNQEGRKQTLSKITVSADKGGSSQFNIAFSCRIL